MVVCPLNPDSASVDMRMPFSAASVSLVRHHLQSWLFRQGVSSSQIDDARLVVSELVGNSIRHAQPMPDGNILVSCNADGADLELSVTDGGSTTSRPRALHPSSTASAGRGMAIVDDLTSSWWAERNGGACTVHAVLSEP